MTGSGTAAPDGAPSRRAARSGEGCRRGRRRRDARRRRRGSRGSSPRPATGARRRGVPAGGSGDPGSRGPRMGSAGRRRSGATRKPVGTGGGRGLEESGGGAAVEPAGATSENCGRWTADGGGGFVRPKTYMSGRRSADFRVWGRRDPGFGMRGLYIGVEGARELQMRCGLRPRDRDRTL